MPKIKIHYFSDDLPRLQMTKIGDWIDLYCAQDMTLKAGDFALVPLGVSMQLPEGYEARTAPRSSTFKRWGLLQANSVGIIDNSYCGTNVSMQLHEREVSAIAARTTSGSSRSTPRAILFWKRATASASSGFSRSSPPLNSRSARRFPL